MSTPENETPNPNSNKYLPSFKTPVTPESRRRFIIIAVVIFIVGVLLINPFFSHKTVKTLTYSTLLRDAQHHKVLGQGDQFHNRS